MKYKYLLFNGVQSMGKASGYFRRVAEQTENLLVRAVSSGRELICEAIRILFTPYAVSAK